ncbi:MAG: (Fe-S)-binding protein [Myxococcota bacterium]|jgi:Fe-S oxidoreductase|nr:(Fe-S)-binding protein [Myxococcota bacterium]
MNHYEIARAVIVPLLWIGGLAAALSRLVVLVSKLRLARPDPRFDDWQGRFARLMRDGFGQRRVLQDFAGLLHVFIFWGFILLQFETIEWTLRSLIPSFHLSSVIGQVPSNVLALSQDVFAALVLLAIGVALVRRFLIPAQHVVRTPDAAIILGLIIALMLSRYLANAADIAAGSNLVPAQWMPLANLLAPLFSSQDSPSSLQLAMLHGNVVAHIALVAFFLYWIPRGKHLHLLAALPNVFFARTKSELAALPPVDIDAVTTAMETDESGDLHLGAKTVNELTWKQLLDPLACTECCRCEAHCPAFATGKALNPMQVIHHVKDASLEHTKDAPVELDKHVSADEIWACTMCGSCVAHCPVHIDHVGIIAEQRRYACFQNELPGLLANTLRQLESSSNPWARSTTRRADWCKDLDLPTLKKLGRTPEYLFFVGCSGSYDDRAIQVNRALVTLLQRAGVDFAILGKEERCCGDLARRAGHEFLFWTTAKENIEKFKKYGIRKVIVSCPHGMNVFRNEYPQLGFVFEEVVHHSELLLRLLDQGKLQLNGHQAKRICFHDPCYLSRWNDGAEAPRSLIDAIPGATLVEMPRHHRDAFCCGGGGARMWMEESAGERVNEVRSIEALETGADRIAVACPFCMTMLSDGLKAAPDRLMARAEEVGVLDLAELLLESALEQPAPPHAP